MVRIELSNYDVPYVLVSTDKLKQLSTSSDQFAEKVRRVLKRALIRAGSIPYVHQNLAIVQQQPTMLIGLYRHSDSYFVVATLNRELSLIHTVTTESISANALIESICECATEFKLV